MLRRSLPYVLALALGVGAAGLVACGGTRGGIPAGPGQGLEAQLEDVRQAVDARRCSDVDGQLRQVDDRINALPTSVDDRLLARLRTASSRLHEIALTECNANIAQHAATTQTTATTDTTTTQTDTTATTDTTDTTDTTGGATSPTDTTTTPTDTTTLPTDTTGVSPVDTTSVPAPAPSPTPAPTLTPPAGAGGGTPPAVVP